jgi:hypothetical protein
MEWQNIGRYLFWELASPIPYMPPKVATLLSILWLATFGCW